MTVCADPLHARPANWDESWTYLCPTCGVDILRKRVERGALLLDRHIDNWVWHVYERDMYDSCHPVLNQIKIALQIDLIELRKVLGIERIQLPDRSWTAEAEEEHGFLRAWNHVGNIDWYHGMLLAHWTMELLRRRDPREIIDRFCAPPNDNAHPIRIIEDARDHSHIVTVQLCPRCPSTLPQAHYESDHLTWHCRACEVDIDSQNITPVTAQLCQNVFDDYYPEAGDPFHPLACSCTGRGWYYL